MAQRPVPLAALRAFEAAARLESFSRAAEEIHVTHGAVSHQVKTLEDYLGAPLFVRVGRGVTLTAQGRSFAERTRAALREIDEAAQAMSRAHHANRLTITTLPSFAARWLMPRIGRFMESHPELEINLHASPALVDFTRDEVDVAIRFGRGGWPNVHAERFMDDEYFPVCSPQFNRGNLPQRLDELPSLRLLRSQDEPWSPWLKAAGLEPTEPVGSEFTDAAMMLQAAAAGQGIALARRSIAESDLAAGALVRLFDISVASSNSYYLVWPPHLARSEKIIAFRDWLLGERRRKAGRSKSSAIQRRRS